MKADAHVNVQYNTHLVDDGFGNLLEIAGPWYNENPEAKLPEGMIRANYMAALRFRFGHWYQLPYVASYAQ